MGLQPGELINGGSLTTVILRYSISAEGSGGGGRNKATTVGEPRGRAQSRGSGGTSSRSVPYRREMSEGANRRYEDGAGRRGKRGRGFDGGLGRSKGRGQRARSFDSARGRSRGRGGEKQSYHGYLVFVTSYFARKKFFKTDDDSFSSR